MTIFKIIITKIGLLLYGCMAFILFWGIAQATFEPNTMLGKLTSSFGGRLVFGFFLALPFIAAEKVLNKYGFKTYYLKGK